MSLRLTQGRLNFKVAISRKAGGNAIIAGLPKNPGVVMFKIAMLLSMVCVMTACSSTGSTIDDSEFEGKLRHVVMFKFKEGTPKEKIKEIEVAFAALPGKIPAVIGYEWGTDVGVEDLDQGYTHCFLVTFKDAAGRAAYLPHPAHKEFVALLKPYLDQVHVIDYVVKSN